MLLDLPCFVDIHERPILSCIETEGKWIERLGQRERVERKDWEERRERQLCQGCKIKKSKTRTEHACSEIFLSVEEEGDLVIINKVRGTRGHYVKQNTPPTETLLPFAVFQVWKLGNVDVVRPSSADV